MLSFSAVDTTQGAAFTPMEVLFDFTPFPSAKVFPVDQNMIGFTSSVVVRALSIRNIANPARLVATENACLPFPASLVM